MEAKLAQMVPPFAPGLYIYWDN